MAQHPLSIDRNVIAGVPGAFIAFGVGNDIDRAFDAAVTVERFELGANGGVSTIADVDPAAERTVLEGTVHPYRAVDTLIELTRTAAPGTVLAQAVGSPSSWRHEKRRHVTETLTHQFPDRAGLLLPLPGTVRSELHAVLDATDRGRLVAVELTAAPRRKFKTVAEPRKGQRTLRFAVLDGDAIVSLHETQSLARKDALTRARTAGKEIRLAVRPLLGRVDHQPYVEVRNTLIVQRAVLRILLADEKKPGATRPAGWIFAGKLPGYVHDTPER